MKPTEGRDTNLHASRRSLCLTFALRRSLVAGGDFQFGSIELSLSSNKLEFNLGVCVKKKKDKESMCAYLTEMHLFFLAD
jgi:hypothetical protein